MIGLGVWAFIGVVWYSAYYFLVFWICGFLMLNNFWKFLVHCYCKHSFCSSLPFFSCYCNFAYVILLKLSHDCQTFWFFAVFILFSLYFDDDVCIDLSPSSVILSSAMSSLLMSLWNAHCISVTMLFFYFQCFLLFFLRTSVSLYYLSVLAYWLFVPVKPLAYLSQLF